MKRRDFIKSISAGTAGASLMGANVPFWDEAQASVSPSDQIRVGVIGVGSRGQWIMQRMLRVSGVRITALCDIYEPRFAEGRKIAGEDTPVYTDYRRLLDEEGAELDVILVASPLRFHAEHVIAALEAGCHVYGEKAMAFTVNGCDRVVKTVQRTGQHFQIGHQYRYVPWSQQAMQRIHDGEIGRITHVYAYWHRNNNWRRPVPDQAPPQLSEFDSLEELINWRMYLEYSRGLLAELGSHQIDLANWAFGAQPEAVTGSGGIVTYDDGRETYDNVQVIFDYPEGRRLTFSSLLNNHKTGYQVHIVGTGGTVVLTLQGATFYYEPDRPNSAVPEDRSAVPDSIVERGITSGATLATEGDMPYRGPGYAVKVGQEAEGGPDLHAVQSFFDALRNDERPFADERVGWGSAVPVAYGHRAIHEKQRIAFADKEVPGSANASESG